MNKLLPIATFESMSNKEQDSYMRSLVREFNQFAETLSRGEIPQFAPPFHEYLESKVDVLDFCTSFFRSYINQLKAIDNHVIERVNITMRSLVYSKIGKDVAFDLIRDVSLMCNTILDTLSQLFKGLPSQAIEELEKGFLKDELHLLNIVSQFQCSGGISFYRVRKGAYTDVKDLFHVPFNERYKCGSYRYSILGYPSLYLASSLETALRECRIEENETYSCNAFRFRNTKEQKAFLDLSLVDRDLTFWEQYSFVASYPLIVACGLKVRGILADKNYPYKQEYAFPQALFQFLRLHTTFEGVTCTSTRYDSPNYRDMKQRNFIFWIKGADRREGFSQILAEMFVASKPHTFSNLDALNDKEKRVLNSEMIDIL